MVPIIEHDSALLVSSMNIDNYDLRSRVCKISKPFVTYNRIAYISMVFLELMDSEMDWNRAPIG